jgi:hypothetical protein
MLDARRAMAGAALPQGRLAPCLARLWCCLPWRDCEIRAGAGAHDMAVALLFGFLALLLAIGVPVAFALVSSSLAALFTGIATDRGGEQTAAGAGSASLLAIPFSSSPAS